VQGHRCLHGRFGEKKCEVRFKKTAGALLKNECFFQRVALGAESILTAPNDVLSEKFTALF